MWISFCSIRWWVWVRKKNRLRRLNNADLGQILGLCTSIIYMLAKCYLRICNLICLTSLSDQHLFDQASYYHRQLSSKGKPRRQSPPLCSFQWQTYMLTIPSTNASVNASCHFVIILTPLSSVSRRLSSSSTPPPAQARYSSCAPLPAPPTRSTYPSLDCPRRHPIIHGPTSLSAPPPL